jgi:hypothetical protein
MLLRSLALSLGLRFTPRRWIVLGIFQAVQWVCVLVFARNHTHDWTALTVASVLLGLPVALACMWRLGAGLGGSRLGAFTAGLWLVAPFAAILLFDDRYRHRYTQEILPRALGLTESGEFVAMVLLLLAAACFTRLYRRGGRIAALYGGLAAGAALAVEGTALLFLPGAVAGALLARRWRRLTWLAGGLAPGVIVFLVRGTWDGLEPGNWDQLAHNFTFIREYFYSLRFLEFLPIAGAIGIARRSFPAAVLAAGWFFAYLAIPGSSSEVLDGSFYARMLPALPAYVWLAASVPLLAPPLPARRKRPGTVASPERPSA